MSEPHADAYADLRARVRAIVATADPVVIGRPAPATPEWTVHDVLAHLVGVTDDVVHGRLDGIASDSWTAAQVELRRAAPTAALLDEWDAHGPQFDEMLRAAPAEIAGQALFDAATHEHDIRHAVAMPGARESEAVVLGWEWLVDARTRGAMPAIRLVTEAGDAVAGTGEPRATVRASRFELLRASSGRRSAAEVAQYAWDPNPDAALLLAGPIFRLRGEALAE